MSEQTSKTHTDSAHLLRAIEHAITYDRQAAPRCVDMQPEYGSVLIRFAEDDMAAVKEWAERTGATAVHGTTTYDTDRQWHEFGTRPGGARGQLAGWDVDLWCSVTGLPPAEHQLDAGWKGDEPGQCGVRCACGTTFDGFDSLGVAVTELHQHIAEPQPVDAPTTQAGE